MTAAILLSNHPPSTHGSRHFYSVISRILSGVLDNYNQPLGKAWYWTSEQTAAISDTTSKAWNATADGVSNAASTVVGGVRMLQVPLQAVLAKRGAG